MVIYIKYVQCDVNYNNKQDLCSATAWGYSKAVNNLFKLWCFSPPANLSNPNNMMAILLNNNNIYGKRISQGSVLRSTTKFLPSYVKRQQQANVRIQSVISSLTSWLSAASLGLTWVNMPKPLKIRLIIILILLALQSSKLSLPTTSSSTMIGSVSLRNWTKIPFNKPVLSRLPGGYKRTIRTANWLPSQQRVINLKYVPVYRAMRLVQNARWLNQPDDMPIALHMTKGQSNLPHW